jgi:hypothetical protein
LPAAATLEKLSDADWKKVTATEKWPVGVTAHHLAGGLEAAAGIVTGLVSGAPPRGNFTMAIGRSDERLVRRARRTPRTGGGP